MFRLKWKTINVCITESMTTVSGSDKISEESFESKLFQPMNPFEPKPCCCILRPWVAKVLSPGCSHARAHTYRLQFSKECVSVSSILKRYSGENVISNWKQDISLPIGYFVQVVENKYNIEKTCDQSYILCPESTILIILTVNWGRKKEKKCKEEEVERCAGFGNLVTGRGFI